MDGDRGRQRNFDHYQSLTMKRFFTTLATIALCASASAQTVKPLAYNLTNGTVMVSTNVTWSNSFKFSTNTVAAQVRTNLLLSAAWLTNTNVGTFKQSIELGAFKSPDEFAELLDGPGNTVLNTEDGVALFREIVFQGANAQTYKTLTRENLGIPWQGLTNTNASTFQTALFSTNAAPVNTTNVSAWTTIQIGTNSFRVPLYQ